MAMRHKHERGESRAPHSPENVILRRLFAATLGALMMGSAYTAFAHHRPGHPLYNPAGRPRGGPNNSRTAGMAAGAAVGAAIIYTVVTGGAAPVAGGAAGAPVEGGGATGEGEGSGEEGAEEQSRAPRAPDGSAQFTAVRLLTSEEELQAGTSCHAELQAQRKADGKWVSVTGHPDATISVREAAGGAILREGTKNVLCVPLTASANADGAKVVLAGTLTRPGLAPLAAEAGVTVRVPAATP